MIMPEMNVLFVRAISPNGASTAALIGFRSRRLACWKTEWKSDEISLRSLDFGLTRLGRSRQKTEKNTEEG